MDVVIKNTKASAAEVLAFLMKVPGICAGKAPDTHGISKPGLHHAAHVLMTKVYEDFQRKSNRGSGVDGSWEEHKPSTVVRRLQNTEAGKKEFEKARKKAYSKYLTRGWSTESAKMLATKEAKKAIRSEEMAKKYFGSFPILDEYGVLKNATRPGDLAGSGLGTGYHPLPYQYRTDKRRQGGGQKVRYYKGMMDIVIDVPYANFHQSKEARSSAIPRRQFIPDEIPQAWQRDAAEAYSKGLVEAIRDVLEQL